MKRRENFWCSVHVDSQHLMTAPKGNSEFCFRRTSMLPETKSRGNAENRLHALITCNSGQHFAAEQ